MHVWVAGKSVQSLVNTCHTWALCGEWDSVKTLYKCPTYFKMTYLATTHLTKFHNYYEWRGSCKTVLYLVAISVHTILSCYVQEEWWKFLVILLLALTNPCNDGFRNMWPCSIQAWGRGPHPYFYPFSFTFRCLAMPCCVCRDRQSCRNKCQKEPENLLFFNAGPLNLWGGAVRPNSLKAPKSGPGLTMGQWVMGRMINKSGWVTWVMSQYLWLTDPWPI